MFSTMEDATCKGGMLFMKTAVQNTLTQLIIVIVYDTSIYETSLHLDLLFCEKCQNGKVE
jgi:hypothetical protein